MENHDRLPIFNSGRLRLGGSIGVDNAYGILQRRIAKKYHVALIPRGAFANILATPGATVGGIHLTAAGQHAISDLIWKIIGDHSQ